MKPNLELKIALPGEEIPDAYFEARYATLREPLGAPAGSELLADDGEALHAWFADAKSGEVVSVGRAHLLDWDSALGTSDYDAEDAPRVPGFEPLVEACNAFATPDKHWPAVQIRQMGTRESHRRAGYAQRLLAALESEAVRLWGARSSWLQAREGALAFYEDCGWARYGETFSVEGIGAHRSMWRPTRLAPISLLNLETHLEDALERVGRGTLGEILAAPPAKLDRLKGFGSEGRAQLEAELNRFSYQLRPDPPRRDLALEAIYRPWEGWSFFDRPDAASLLEEISATGGSGYDPRMAWLLSEASILAYHRDEEAVEKEWKKLGVEDVVFLDGKGAQGHVAIGDHGLYVLFRGTEPDDLDDLITDLQVRLVGSSRGSGLVHRGFAQAVVTIWPELIALARRHEDKPLWIGGHSLGAALAVLAAESLPSVEAVYTYGAPKVGDGDFARSYPWPVHRIVHNNDIVTMIPPFPRYRHVGEAIFIDELGEVRFETNLIERAHSRITGALEDLRTLLQGWRGGQYRQVPDSRITDHAPRNYAQRLLSALDS